MPLVIRCGRMGRRPNCLDSSAQSQPYLTSQRGGAQARSLRPIYCRTATEPLRLNWHRHTSRGFALDIPKLEADDRFIRTLKKDRFMTRVLRCLVVFGILVAGPWLAPTPAIAGSADFWATQTCRITVSSFSYYGKPSASTRDANSRCSWVQARVWYYYSCTCQLSWKIGGIEFDDYTRVSNGSWLSGGYGTLYGAMGAADGSGWTSPITR